MQTGTHILRFSASPADFEQAFADLRAVLEACGVCPRARNNAELVFEEVVSNVIRHGSIDGRTHQIELSLTCDAREILLTFEDDGEAFDPLDRPMPILPKSLEEARLGGLGILLMRKASTGLHYERTSDQKNRLIVTIAAA
jgi:anti-sigma regulatory factor (Ser/Thr protein kinase)